MSEKSNESGKNLEAERIRRENALRVNRLITQQNVGTPPAEKKPKVVVKSK